MKNQVKLESGILVIDDSTLDKPYSQKIELVTKHWSGKHHRVVNGINLVTLLWTDGDRHIPCDYRIYDKAKDGLTKNDHFRAMLEEAKTRGFVPECICFDSWYASLRACLNNRYQAIFGHFQEVLSCFYCCLLRTCGISIAFAIRSVDRTLQMYFSNRLLSILHNVCLSK